METVPANNYVGFLYKRLPGYFDLVYGVIMVAAFDKIGNIHLYAKWDFTENGAIEKYNLSSRADSYYRPLDRIHLTNIMVKSKYIGPLLFIPDFKGLKGLTIIEPTIL